MMRCLLKVAVLVICLQRAQGLWLDSLLDSRENEAPASPASREEMGRRWSMRPRREVESQCSLRTLLLQVRDLGLGYDSDETVLFKYCSGVCPRVQSNHDLTLTNLFLRGALPPPLPGEQWHSSPCCRPTHHEDLAFLDNAHRWHKVEQLSAAGCTCVG